jgi:hypothetical protein
MKIYINNEEVVCSQKMTIKESLKNTSSVILNNVYPKSWETDKDYVSRFYMPKDYSHCKVIDESESTKEYSLIDGIMKLENYWVYNNVIVPTTERHLEYIKIIPGQTYTITIENNGLITGTVIYECDDMDFQTPTTRIGEVLKGTTATLELTPTKPYICWEGTNDWWAEYGDFWIKVLALSVTLPDNIIFSGIVKNSGNINLNPRYPHYATLQLLDYKTLLSEGDNLNYVLEKQNVKDAIREVTSGLEGFMVGDLLIPDTEMAAYNCNEKTPYDVFEYISEITNSIWFTKAISEDIVTINFYSNDNLPTAENIEYTQEYFTDHNIQDIKYSYSANDYRNKQVITNEKAVSAITQTENITYYNSNINTTYPIASIVSITNGTKNYSFASETAKSIGQYANIYYRYNSTSLNVDTGVKVGETLTITYYPIVLSRQVAYNETEINRIATATGRNGTIARYEKRTDTNDEMALSQIAQTYLDYKGVPEITLTVKSYYQDILDIGQKVFFNGPLDDLKTNYLVTDKQIEMTTTADQQVIFYTYKLSSSFNDESSLNFFDNQRRKLEGNIEEGEFIPRYIDLPSSTNIIFYDLNSNEIPIPNDILDGILDIELIGASTNKLNAKLNFKL